MKPVWKEALVFAVLSGAVVAAISFLIQMSIDDRRTQRSVGGGAFVFFLILAGAFGRRWLDHRRALRATELARGRASGKIS